MDESYLRDHRALSGGEAQSQRAMITPDRWIGLPPTKHSTRPCTQTHTHACTLTHTHTHTKTHACTCTHLYALAHTHSHTQNTCTCTKTHTHTHTTGCESEEIALPTCLRHWNSPGAWCLQRDRQKRERWRVEAGKRGIVFILIEAAEL